MPGRNPVLVDVPRLQFVMLDGSGDPNGPEFGQAVEALYSLSYAVKMSYRRPDAPLDYEPYTVYPLEGVWDLLDRSRTDFDKSNLKYTLMIRQPSFLTADLYLAFLEQTKQKKANPFLERLRFEEFTEGRCCQALHLGPFEDEPATFERMEQYCAEQGVARKSKLHREIYLSDPRKSEPARLKTVLRFQLARVPV